METTISECSELRNRLMKMRRKERHRIVIAVVYCIGVGIVMSQFLIIGATFKMFAGFNFILALIIHYRAAVAK